MGACERAKEGVKLAIHRDTLQLPLRVPIPELSRLAVSTLASFRLPPHPQLSARWARKRRSGVLLMRKRRRR